MNLLYVKNLYLYTSKLIFLRVNPDSFQRIDLLFYYKASRKKREEANNTFYYVIINRVVEFENERVCVLTLYLILPQ